MNNLLKKGKTACDKRNFYDKQNLKREKSKLSGYYGIFKEVAGEAVGQINPFRFIYKEFSSRLQNNDINLYSLKNEKIFSDSIVKGRIEEMLDFLEGNGFELIGTNMTGKIGISPSSLGVSEVFNPVMVSVSFQLVLKRDDYVFLTRVIFDNNPFKTKGKNTVKSSPEMLIESMVADHLAKDYEGYTCIPMNLYIWQTDESKSVVPQNGFGDTEKGNVAVYEGSNPDAYKNLISAIKENQEGTHEPSDFECNMCPYKELCLYTKPAKDIELKPISVSKGSKTMRFTKEQQEFINFDRGIARVLAGAGSGKTTSVVGRIIHLLKTDDVEPCDFLLTTFTEKGIREMKEKLDYWLKVEGLPYSSDEFEITNFNTFGYQIIRKNFMALGFHSEPRLLDRSLKMHIIAGILDEYPLIDGLNYYSPLMSTKNAGGAIVKMAKMIDIMKENSVGTVEDCIKVLPSETYGAVVGEEKDINPKTGRLKTYKIYALDHEAIFEVYQEFLNRTYGNGYIEYDDQVKLATEVIRNDDSQRYKYKHITIDEFQDSHEMEMEFIKVLAEKDSLRSLVVVGDDAQSIYAFRGVNMKNILDFPNVFKGCHEFTLLNNFRSTQEILDVANTVIATSKSNLAKKLKGFKNGNKPVLNITLDSIGNAVEEAKKIVLGGFNPQDVAIIAGTRKELVKVAKLLRDDGIPYVMSVSEFIDESPVIAAISGLLNFIKDTSLTYELSKYLIVADYEKMSASRELGAYVDEQAQLISNDIEVLNEDEKTDYVMSKIKEISNQDAASTILFEALQQEGYQTLDEITVFLKQVMTYKTDLSVKAIEENYDAITLTTAHAAKGREFKNVILLLDHFDFVKNRDEEIRLLFVAITRAMDSLTLIGQNYKADGLRMAVEENLIDINILN